MLSKENRKNTCRNICAITGLILIGLSSALAQNKVVVVPLGGDDAPQYRIVQDPNLYDPTDGDSGRLEYTHDKSADADSLWGTVCWDEVNGGISSSQRQTLGETICKEMGYQGYAELIGSSAVTDSGGNTLIMLNLSDCPDTADSIADCGNTSPTDVSSCTHADDIGILCGKRDVFKQLQVRIVPNTGVNNSPQYQAEGRIEVTIGNETGSVCDDDFRSNNNAAQLVCRALGYHFGVVKTLDNVVDAPEGTPIMLDDVICPNESDSASCTFLRTNNCQHSEDVGVSCGYFF